MASLVAILIELSWGSTKYAWSNYHVLVPLILGFAGTVVYHVYEAPPWCKEPVVPPRLFSNRTSAAALAMAFIHQMICFWQIFFLPVYFQSVKLRSPVMSGVDFLPSVVLGVPAAIAAGAALTKWGRYRPLHALSWTCITIGSGVFSLLDAQSSSAEWVIYQMIAAIGIGILLTTSLAAVQAPLADGDVATATATWAFMRSYGGVFGVSVPAAVFNSRFGQLATQRVHDRHVLAHFARGAAYSSISKEYILGLPPSVRHAIIETYTDSLRLVWYISLVFCGVGFLTVLIEKKIDLRTENEGEFGIKQGQSDYAMDDLAKR